MRENAKTPATFMARGFIDATARRLVQTAAAAGDSLGCRARQFEMIDSWSDRMPPRLLK